ncbi:diflavin oxidoreductase [Flavobacterium suzhouense]|uniref:Sulfite reductase flavoprotein subunit alpha n=1 Tax=Flavobacterium suzhouense TaxID=1529638 RepID=A0ABW5NTU1_9FLAO
MLSESKYALLKELVKDASNEELIFSKGYIAGFLDGNHQSKSSVAITESQAITVKPVIIYGTETGNSKKVASTLLAGLKKKKINSKVIDVFQYDVEKLKKESLALFVISTQGEGEFPQNAQKFYESLQLQEVNLQNLTYAVLGLGDSSYPLYNNAAVLLDKILEERGATRLLPLVKADVDYSDLANKWEVDLFSKFLDVANHQRVLSAEKTQQSDQGHKKLYTGVITHKVILNDIGSNKQTYHIEITPDEEVLYEPGDALGIYPKNDITVVDSILSILKIESELQIKIDTETKSANDWFIDRNVLGLSKRSVGLIGELFGVSFPDDVADLEYLLAGVEIPEEFSIESLVKLLLPIAPRLYSISSSAEAHDGQVHLTVNLNTFDANGATKHGLASGYLADYPVGSAISFYIHKNNNFRLPPEDKDIIMIGPGTGIAPFRSFIAERDSVGAQGRNWLFFGEQHFVHDFYYQTEVQDWLASGILTRLETAFSRDQQQKIYVQDRIREKGEELNQWIEDGAIIYICGQKAPMSIDVIQAITEVVSTQRKISFEQAKEIVSTLIDEGRLLKDVY